MTLSDIPSALERYGDASESGARALFHTPSRAHDRVKI